MRNNPPGADNQQESLSQEEKAQLQEWDEQLAWFLAGFTEGEGSTCVSIIYHPTAAYGVWVRPEFLLYQHKDRRDILELAKDFFGAGAIRPKKGNEDVLVLSITNHQVLMNSILPFLEKYMVYSARTAVYESFAEIVRKRDAKRYASQQDLIEMVQLAYAMPTKGKRKRTLEEVLDRILRGHTPDTPCLAAA